jgi:hypothetical protein
VAVDTPDEELDDEELVFNPSSGFHSARILETPANIVLERDGRTLTASLVSERDCTTLHFTVLGFDPPVAFGNGKDAWLRVDGPAHIRDDRGREIASHPRWQTGGSIRRRADGSLMLDWQLMLERLPSDARSVELSVGGPAGDWAVEFPLVSTESAGTPATRSAASDAHHGIAITARAVARSTALTAVEIETTVAPDPSDLPHRPKRYVQGIGSHGPGRISDQLLVLRDDLGNEHRERWGLGFMPAPRNRQVVQFPELPEAARSAMLEIPFVAIQERSDETLSLAVPSDSDIEFVGCAARAAVSRANDHQGPSVRVEIRPKDGEAERQLMYFNRVEAHGGSPIGMTIVHCPGQPIVMNAPDPSGVAPTVIMYGPVLKLRGPWRLELALPAEVPAAPLPRSG